jgi:hypothetical protein
LHVLLLDIYSVSTETHGNVKTNIAACTQLGYQAFYFTGADSDGADLEQLQQTLLHKTNPRHQNPRLYSNKSAQSKSAPLPLHIPHFQLIICKVNDHPQTQPIQM